jgi:hypothetical protein
MLENLLANCGNSCNTHKGYEHLGAERGEVNGLLELSTRIGLPATCRRRNTSCCTVLSLGVRRRATGAGTTLSAAREY